MSKKPQPQKGENPKIKNQTVDQQNEPFLRALQKKVRNINKKLTDIAELQGKDNLKPEQVEKINRKDALLEERTRVEENASFFKQVYAENVVHYRNNQLRELQILARAISIYHTSPQIPEQAKLSALWRALGQQQDQPNLNAAITSLANALKDIANDKKLQKSLTSYVQKHGNEEIKKVEAIQQKIVNDIQTVKPQIEEAKVQQPPVKAIVETPQPEPQIPVIQTKVEAVVQNIPEAPQVVIQQQPKTTVQQVIPPPPTPSSQQQPEKPAETKEEAKRPDYNNRPYRERPAYRGKGNYRGGNNERREGEGERRQYKPKFEEKKAEQKQAEDSDKSDQSEEVRQFRREEIKKLEDDGFIIIGKPKPKNTQQQVRNYEKQHGRKYQPRTENP